MASACWYAAAFLRTTGKLTRIPCGCSINDVFIAKLNEDIPSVEIHVTCECWCTGIHSVLQSSKDVAKGMRLLLHDRIRILQVKVPELVSDVVQATKGDHGARCEGIIVVEVEDDSHLMHFERNLRSKVP